MMEGSDNWNSRLLNCFILCLFISFQSACAQEGFVSIQCCGDSNFIDSRTNISWKTDSDWYPDRLTCPNIVRPVQNDTGNDTARFFTSGFGNKFCYDLTTVKNQDYLIRGTFRYGDLERIPPGSFFNVLIGITQIGTVNSSYDTEVEGIFRATNDYINFCLEKGKEYPYISKLELRTLSDSDYFQLEPSSVLKLIDRVDVGSNGSEIRYATHAEAMWRVVEVALSCIEPFSAYRPCMADIVRELEDALIIENNASEYMKSIDSFGGSNRFSIERTTVFAPTPTPTEPSPVLSPPNWRRKWKRRRTLTEM